jgi:hypothetical protein
MEPIAEFRCKSLEPPQIATSETVRSAPPVDPQIDKLSRDELVSIINMRRDLVRLADLIDWTVFDREFGAQFVSSTGLPALPTRLVAGLLHRKHLYSLSDEEIVQRWVESPYFKNVRGNQHLQLEVDCDPFGMEQWRRRIHEEGVEWLPTEAIEAAEQSGPSRKASVTTTVMDTTVQCKAIAHLTGRRPLNRTREQPADTAKAPGIDLRKAARAQALAPISQPAVMHTRGSSAGCESNEGGCVASSVVVTATSSGRLAIRCPCDWSRISRCRAGFTRSVARTPINRTRCMGLGWSASRMARLGLPANSA